MQTATTLIPYTVQACSDNEKEKLRPEMQLKGAKESSNQYSD